MSLEAYNLNGNRQALQSNLLDWYRAYRRPLPWRIEPSLYRTVVSEFMCQQTQIATVLPYFDRWLKRFPDFRALADAPEDAVLKHWEGLGYYSRARNLHKLARTLAPLVATNAVPADAKSWEAFPGIGPYTAAAITSITFGTPVAVVDGNVIRVLTRLTADATPYKDGPTAAKALRPRAEALLNPENPGDHNQALMELGATICLKTRPLCTVCPLVGPCAGNRTGEPDQFPNLARRTVTQVTVHRLWWVDGDGRLALQQIPADARRLAGHWELPPLNKAPRPDDGWTEVARRQRGISNQRITEILWQPPDGVTEKQLQPTLEHPNRPLEQLSAEARASRTLSGPHRKWIAALLG
ncbi:MAG: A/G-specific adenine glycosylase [Opitutales bacterium]